RLCGGGDEKARLSLLKSPQGGGRLEIFAGQPYRPHMGTILFAVVSIFAFRFRSRSSLELKLLPFNISWPSCADSGPVGVSFHLSTASWRCCSTGFGRS